MTPVVTFIDSQSSTASRLAELWRYRELLGFLVWRDLTVRYRQTLLGAGWALLQPLATMVVFAVLFGRLLAVQTDGRPYPPFVLAALVPWTYLAASLGNGSTSLLTNTNLVAKVYFPRLLLPAAAVLTPGVDAAIGLALAFGFAAWHGLTPGPALFALPLFVLLALVIALGTTTWLSALTVRYRDIRYTLPFATQLWLFATPVAYSSSTIPDSWRVLYAINPMVTVVDGFRWILLGGAPPGGAAAVVSCVVACVMLVGGVIYFRRVEQSFADII